MRGVERAKGRGLIAGLLDVLPERLRVEPTAAVAETRGAGTGWRW